MSVSEVTFRAMGTTWAVFCDRAELLPGAASLVATAEQQLSRFLEGSALSRLNADRVVENALLARVVRAALRLRTTSAGCFDPTLGAELVALGYDRSFERLQPSSVHATVPGVLHVHTVGNEVTLDGPGRLDLGGIAKGFTVDLVHDWLRAHGAEVVLVDGGGDLRGSGAAWPIGVGPGLAVRLHGDAVATSSTQHRRWKTAPGGVAHHVIDPVTRRPSASPIQVATVRSPDATTADALATAVLVDPERILPLLASLGASALVCDAERRWWSTETWKEAA